MKGAMDTRVPKTCVVGGIVMYNQWQRLPNDIEVHKIIHLVRDPKATAYSQVRNEKDKKLRGAEHRAHYRQGDEVPPVYEAETEEVESWERRIVEKREAFQRVLREKETLEVAYEDLTDNRSTETIPREEALRILEFLGLNYHQLSTRLIKTGPQ